MSLSDGNRTKEPALNHFDEKGQAHMVDVSSKAETLRIATAKGRIKVSPPVYAAIEGGTARKGDVLGVARLAGIMAAKKTSDLIPLCHPLPLTAVGDLGAVGVYVPVSGDLAGQHQRYDRHRQDNRQNRGRDGSPHRRQHRPPHHL